MDRILEDSFDHYAKFKLLNNYLETEKNVNRFYSGNIEYFRKKEDFSAPENSIDWHFRSFRALREIFHSSVMYTESRVVKNQYCIASIFFTKYYSFLHAVKSVMYLTPVESFDPRTGHSQIINLFANNYCQGKRKVFDKKEFVTFSKTLRNLREITSYQVPHSGADFLTEAEFNEIDLKLSNYLLKLYELSNYLSFILYKEHKSVPINENISLFNKSYDKYFSTPHPFKENHVDYSDSIFKHDALKVNKTYCHPFVFFLEHEVDDFLSFGSFDYLNNSNISFNEMNVVSFIMKAI